MNASRQSREALMYNQTQKKLVGIVVGRLQWCSKARYCGNYCQHKTRTDTLSIVQRTSLSSSNNSNTSGVIGRATICNRSGSRGHISITRQHSNRTAPLSLTSTITCPLTTH